MAPLPEPPLQQQQRGETSTCGEQQPDRPTSGLSLAGGTERPTVPGPGALPGPMPSRRRAMCAPCSWSPTGLAPALVTSTVFGNMRSL